MDKVVIITGGSRGIGAETALLAARQGYRICINYQSDEDAAHRVLEQVRALGAQAIAVRADVSIEDEVIARLKVNLAVGEFSDANLRTLQIRQNADWTANFCGNPADLFRQPDVLFRRSVREVQAHDIYAGAE